MAEIIDGKAIAKAVRSELKARAAALAGRGVVPGLAVVLVGDDPASAVYVRTKTRACKRVGIRVSDHRLPAHTTQDALCALVRRLNDDPAVHGLLVQSPLPAGLDFEAVVPMIDPRKDVDGFHPENVGRLVRGDAGGLLPCTPAGVMYLLSEAGVELRGAEAVVVGRSNIVGKPVAQMLIAAHATVTVCHSRTRDLAAHVGRAEVLVVAAGSPGLVKGAWIRPGAVVIDVGSNLVGDALVGDVEQEAAMERARAITPVPGGVGPMTVAMLLANTVLAAEQVCSVSSGLARGFPGHRKALARLER